MRFIVIGLVVSFLSCSVSAAPLHTEKMSCMVGTSSMEKTKSQLLLQAKSAAASELFGELITSYSAVENFELIKNSIASSTIGYLRIEGSPSYSNGQNLGEVCVNIKAYVTKEDLNKFEPVAISNKQCVSDGNLTLKKIKQYAENQVVTSALLNYSHKLKGKSTDELLKLVHNIKYIESGFIPDTSTYCARFNANVYPVEIEGSENSQIVAKTARVSSTVAGIEMVTIPSGSFQMGSNSGDGDEKPVHTVHINSFKMGKYEVTQAQWRSVMGSNPSYFKGNNNPVEMVSWDDVQQFIRKLNSQTGRHFRLPSESEWEYSARAGSSTKYSWGNSVSRNRANCAVCGSQWGAIKTAPVGSFSPNSFGLYDMHGNVWEWVEDMYHDSYNGALSDGSAWDGSGQRVLRGGSWISYSYNIRSADRFRVAADYRREFIGFRLVQD